nr:uncharacterized protein LOC111503349 isoform X2 [Leptinotarsa decemlineata]
MDRQNGFYLNPQIFSTPPPNYHQASASKQWNFKSPPPSIQGTAVNEHSPSPTKSFKRDPPPSPAQSYISEITPSPRPPFSTTPVYPFSYVENQSVGSFNVAQTPSSFSIASSTSLVEETNRYANVLALYYKKGYAGDRSSSSFLKPTDTFPTTTEPHLFQHPPCLPPLPSQPPPPPPQNPPPPQTPPPLSLSSVSTSSQYRSSHNSSQQHSHTYSKNFYNYKRQSDSEDYHKKNAKKRKKPLSQNIPQRKDWSVQDAKRALDVEKESNKRSKRQSLIIKFPDLELNREIVSNFHPSIENVHFQQPSTPRFCFVTLRDSADPERVINQLNKIPFGQGHLIAEYKKDREEDLNIGPEDIDPLTLYVGNLAQEVTKEDMVKCYPRQKRIDIGYAKKMKYTRYAFVSFKCVEDSIEAFQRTHASQMYSKSLIVRFRRLHGTVGMPGEPKPQSSQRTDIETPSNFATSLDEKKIEEQENQSTPWDIDVSKWDVDTDIVKQERPETPQTDEELDIKPAIPLKSRFMPGSLELAISSHRPNIMKIESEEYNDSAGITSEQSVDVITRGTNCENSENSSSIIEIDEELNVNDINSRIKKEQIEISNEPTTYDMLRSLNNKIKNYCGERPELNTVVIKKENMEDSVCNEINSPENDGDYIDCHFTRNVKKTTTSLFSKSIRNRDFVSQNKYGGTIDQLSKRSRDLNKNIKTPAGTNDNQKNFISNIQSELLEKQGSDRELDKCSTETLADPSSHSIPKNNEVVSHSNKGTIQNNMKSQSRSVEKTDYGQLTEKMTISVSVQNDEPRIDFNESSNERSRIMLDTNMTGNECSNKGPSNITHKNILKCTDLGNNKKSINDYKEQTTSHSSIKLVGSKDAPKLDQKGKEDSRAIASLNRNATSKNHFNEQMKEKITLMTDSSIKINIGQNIGDKENVTQMKDVDLGTMTSLQLNKESGESPKIQHVFSLRGNENTEFSKESFEKTSSLVETLPNNDNKNSSNDQDKIGGNPIPEGLPFENDIGISDWMSADIKPEPVDEDETNDGDEDDSSDDNLNFNSFLSGNKNKTRKKKLN